MKKKTLTAALALAMAGTLDVYKRQARRWPTR